MVATEQHFRNTFVRVHLGSGVVRAVEQAIREGVLLGGICMTQCTGQQPRHCIDQHHGRQLTAGQDIIADRPFFIDVLFDEALVDAFVAPGDEDQRFLFGQFAYARLRQLAALRRKVDHLRLPAPGGLPGIRQRALQRLDLHHHARATAEGPVVHRLVAVLGVVPWIPAGQREQPLLYRTAGDAIVTDRAEHLRKDADDAHPQTLVHG